MTAVSEADRALTSRKRNKTRRKLQCPVSLSFYFLSVFNIMPHSRQRQRARRYITQRRLLTLLVYHTYNKTEKRGAQDGAEVTATNTFKAGQFLNLSKVGT